jgi:hypothetical protein
MQERENDIKAVVDARKELEGHHKVLHEKTLTVLQKFKDELDADLTTRYTKGEQELLDMADEGTHLLSPPLPYLLSLIFFPFSLSSLYHKVIREKMLAINTDLAAELLTSLSCSPSLRAFSSLLFKLLTFVKELVARAKFAKQQAEFQHEADVNMEKVRNELLAMEELHKVCRVCCLGVLMLVFSPIMLARKL